MKSMNVFRSFALLLISSLLFVQCNKDDDDTQDNVRFEVTDAPIDDANIEGVFVTVVGVEVNGEAISNFSGTQTIDLMAYQKGEVKSLGGADLTAGSYSDVQLVLDFAHDATGNSPGCYVMTKDGTKHALDASADHDSRIKANGSFSAPASGQATIVFDMDLRKSITYNNTGGSSDYSFVTNTEMDATTRLVVKSTAGTIKGNCADDMNQAGSRIVVYAYKKGEYTLAETLPQGTSNIRFKNAVNSAVVGSDGNFTLAFLESGNYELHFVGYEDTNSDGKLEIKGMLLLDILSSLDLSSIKVDAGANVTLNVSVSGILPL